MPPETAIAFPPPPPPVVEPDPPDLRRTTLIAWTDHTMSPWGGCEVVSEACRLCYARTLARRFPDLHGEWGPDGERVGRSDDYWHKKLVVRNRSAAKAGRMERVFIEDMGDLFEDRRDLDAWRARLWPILEASTNLDFQLLTKRPQNITALVPPTWMESWPHNVWMGVTVENAARAAERIPILQTIPAPIRYLSVEPLLAPIPNIDLDGIVWVIVGGESSAGAHPLDPDWARGILRQCRDRGVAFFMKQFGTPWARLNSAKPRGAAEDPAEWPEDLRVREMPLSRVVRT
jgi:protein gp37